MQAAASSIGDGLRRPRNLGSEAIAFPGLTMTTYHL
jgi:hypothetical protein